ncbi:MAG: hypothetical protein AABZ47_18255 [Planctomycetota bacterium]
MSDEANEELQRLLTCDIDELVASISVISAPEGERHARAILNRIGGPTFEKYLMRITETMIPKGGGGPPRNVDAYYFAVRDFFPHIPEEDDVLGRLGCFVTQMCRLRLEAHMRTLE